MKRMLFIFSPRPSKEQIKGQLAEVPDVFTGAGYEPYVHVTQKQKDTADVMARLSKKVDVAVCSGGNGTFNETIFEIVKLKKIPLLGYTPIGSTNDFATSLGISRHMPLAAWDIMRGTPFAIDAGTFCRDRDLVYIATFGAFTEVSYLASQDGRSLLGYQVYILEDVKSLAGLKPYYMEMEQDGQAPEEDFASGMVTNTISVGGFKGLVNQSIALNDSLFGILSTRMPRTPVDLSNIISYIFLREGPNGCVHKFKTSSIRLTSGQGMDWALDSEYGGSRTKMTIGNIGENIQILLRNHPEGESEQKRIG